MMDRHCQTFTDIWQTFTLLSVRNHMACCVHVHVQHSAQDMHIIRTVGLMWRKSAMESLDYVFDSFRKDACMHACMHNKADLQFGSAKMDTSDTCSRHLMHCCIHAKNA